MSKLYVISKINKLVKIWLVFNIVFINLLNYVTL